jgi:branched-chain amino acid transport system substrate-binding protein
VLAQYHPLDLRHLGARNGTGNAIVKTGGDSWFFLTADYAFGHALERDTEAVVLKNGGKVLGKVRHPLNTSDFSFLLQAQASKAKIIGLANAGGDTTNAIKQAAEFGIVKGGRTCRLARLPHRRARPRPAHGAGADLHGVVLLGHERQDARLGEEVRRAEPRHPSDHDPRRRVRVGHALPEGGGRAQDDDGTKVIAKMKETPTDDPLFGKGTIRADGRKIHDMYLFEVKKPAESKAPWDYYKLRATIPAAQAFRPIDQGDCPLVKK